MQAVPPLIAVKRNISLFCIFLSPSVSLFLQSSIFSLPFFPLSFAFHSIFLLFSYLPSTFSLPASLFSFHGSLRNTFCRCHRSHHRSLLNELFAPMRRVLYLVLLSATEGAQPAAERAARCGDPDRREDRSVKKHNAPRITRRYGIYIIGRNYSPTQLCPFSSTRILRNFLLPTLKRCSSTRLITAVISSTFSPSMETPPC